MKQTETQEEKGILSSDTPIVGSNQILEHTFEPNFLVATDGRHISVGANVARDWHTRTSAAQPSLNLRPKRSDSSDVVTITIHGGERTFAHRHNVSRIEIADMFMRLR